MHAEHRDLAQWAYALPERESRQADEGDGNP